MKLSTTMATEARRAMAFAAQRLAFAEFEQTPLWLGHKWLDARGAEQSVHVRVQNLIVDYIDFALASGTLQNQTCPICLCPTGSFHVTSREWAYRTAASSASTVAAARAAGTSATMIKAQCRLAGLQNSDAPLREVAPGLDPHSGVAYARLHNDFEGTGKVTLEATIQRAQSNAGSG